MYYSYHTRRPRLETAEALNLVEGLSSRQLIDEARLVLELLADAQLARFAARVALARGMCRLDPACFRERPSCLTNSPRAALERTGGTDPIQSRTCYCRVFRIPFRKLRAPVRTCTPQTELQP